MHICMYTIHTILYIDFECIYALVKICAVGKIFKNIYIYIYTYLKFLNLNFLY